MSSVFSLQESSSSVTPKDAAKDAGCTGHIRRHFLFFGVLLGVIYFPLTRSLSSMKLLLLSINDDDDDVGAGAEYTGVDGLRNILGMKNFPLPSSSTAAAAAATGFEFTSIGFDIYTTSSSNNDVRHSTGKDDIDGDRADADLLGSKE